MASDSKKISYFNTLMFTIISSIVSLLLLGMLFFDMFKPYIPFIITVEVGLFAIILWCIYKIYVNEILRDAIKNDRNFTIDFMQCPDYYITRNIDGKSICSNEYITEDQYRNKHIIKIYPADAIDRSFSFPSTHNPNFINSNNPEEKFALSDFANNPTLSSNEKKCDAVFGNVANFDTYSRIPWTNVKARCDSFAS